MPSRIRINGQWYDASNVPPWYEDIRPHVDNAPTDAEQVAATYREAQVNARRNSHGSEVVGCIILGLGLAILIISAILLARVLL